jgi:hypothetical protein
VSTRVIFTNGMFEPIEDVKGLQPGQGCTVFQMKNFGRFERRSVG